MPDIQWFANPGPEIRLIGQSQPVTTARYSLGPAPRMGTGPLFHDPYDKGYPALSLPAVLLPCVGLDGGALDLRALVQEIAPEAHTVGAAVVLPPGHPHLVASPSPDQPHVIPALWISGISELHADEITRRARSLHGLLIQPDESVISLGSTSPRPLWLQRLPRVVLEQRSEIADNTDVALSMGHLLEQFVLRFSEPADALSHVCIATGYLYQRGLARTLGLLRNPAVHNVQLLFSGKTDRSTARLMTALFSQALQDEIDQEPTDELWQACRQAASEDRLKVRVYTDAFLHAKLFLAFDGIDKLGKLRDGYAVVGSSNVSGPGLLGGGNLELDVSLTDRDRTTALHQWFQRRWEEASLPEPALLAVLEGVRPLPPPVFQTEGLEPVWRAGTEARLGAPAQHLSLLAQIYAAQLEGLNLPSEQAFVAEGERTITPTPEQEEGVIALAQRLLRARVAFLADSVGLGKTITALGLVHYLARNHLLDRAALIAPEKLWPQWEADAERAGIPFRLVKPINRHKLERWDAAQAQAELAPFDLLVIEEAHESLRNRGNKLWQHVRAHLRAHPICRLVLVSATPWNNRREDIYNYLLLAWQDGRPLRERYLALGQSPLQHELPLFLMQPTGGARLFENLSRERYRAIFDAVFVQRTRSTLEQLGRALGFPERRVQAENTPDSEVHEALYAALADLLSKLSIPYQEPFRAILRAAGAPDEEDEGESNLRRSFLIQLYKRAESSLFALAISLSRIGRRLREFEQRLRALIAAADPTAALESYLRETYLRVDDEALGVPEEEIADWLSPAEKVRYAALTALVSSLDAARARAVLTRLIDEQIATDLAALETFQQQLTFEIEERSPKDLQLVRLARAAYASGHKPILVAGYADTATRAFIRLIDAMPDARIALALGGGEAWMYRPGTSRRAALTEAEWIMARDLPPAERRDRILLRAGRAEQLPRQVALDAFAPRARAAHALTLATTGGPIDILVGSEAISVGQNLQDSTCLIHLDLPWNPMIIEQRIGRIDRRGGGRPAPDRPDGRTIVDIFYCWSAAAVECEVALRDRLQKKASGAMADSNFDEILLYELEAQIRKQRADKAAQATAAAQVLGAAQQRLAEEQVRSGEAGAAGSHQDGLRRLSSWARENEPARVEPVVAAGQIGADEGGGFVLLLELLPIDRLGVPLPGPPLYETVVVTAAPVIQPDLERGVLALVEGGGATASSQLPRREWTAALVALDQRLQDLRQGLLDRHNREAAARLGQTLSPAARRSPSERLRGLLVKASDALLAAVKRLGADTAWKERLRQRKDKLAFLMNQALKPQNLPELLAEQDEADVFRALALIRDFTMRFLDQDFDDTFDALCGGLYAARQAESVQPELPAIAQDGIWADLRLRVLAATYQTSARRSTP